MCEDIGRRRRSGKCADFALISGDLAYSGKPAEYALVAGFLDALVEASGIPKGRVFCIPGNHDINRDAGKLSFAGARAILTDQQALDGLLGAREELEPLLIRQQSYRDFQTTYFATQSRVYTEDLLGYVSRLTLDEVRLAIVALDSSWTADGGALDHGRLLIGERQVINALHLASDTSDAPHVVLGMVHHPLHLLNEFDRLPTQARIESGCDFLHYGHLHKPECRMIASDAAGCLMLAGGAVFETRQAINSYAYVELDVLSGLSTVTRVQYDPSRAIFEATTARSFPFTVARVNSCDMADLAMALMNAFPRTREWAYYFAAILLDRMAELPTPTDVGVTFASLAALSSQGDPTLVSTTRSFVTFRNALRLFDDRLPLKDILSRYGAPVETYTNRLHTLCAEYPELTAQLTERDRNARRLAKTTPNGTSTHTDGLLADLLNERDWPVLREQARRHLESGDPGVRVNATRMLAVSLAHSQDDYDHVEAIALYQQLVRDGYATPIDSNNLVTLLRTVDPDVATAKGELLKALQRHTDRNQSLIDTGYAIAEASGDRAFRRQIDDIVRIAKR